MSGKLEQVITKMEAYKLQFQLENEVWVSAIDSKLQKKCNNLKWALLSSRSCDRSYGNSNWCQLCLKASCCDTNRTDFHNYKIFHIMGQSGSHCCNSIWVQSSAPAETTTPAETSMTSAMPSIHLHQCVVSCGCNCAKRGHHWLYTINMAWEVVCMQAPDLVDCLQEIAECSVDDCHKSGIGFILRIARCSMNILNQAVIIGNSLKWPADTFFVHCN